MDTPASDQRVATRAAFNTANQTPQPVNTSAQERYCPACLDAHPRLTCSELTRGLG